MNKIEIEKLQLSHRDLIHGEFYYTPDALAGTGGKEHNIIQYDERVEILTDFGHTPIFYKIVSDPLEEQPDKGWIPDIIKLENERLAWSLETFTHATPISSLHKLQEEIREIAEEIECVQSDEGLMEEYADAMMCLFDSIGRCGYTLPQIFQAFEKKLAKNKKRTWTKNPDNSYSHNK